MNVIPSKYAFKCKRFPDGLVQKLLLLLQLHRIIGRAVKDGRLDEKNNIKDGNSPSNRNIKDGSSDANTMGFGPNKSWWTNIPLPDGLTKWAVP
jgi:hypothetical protein